MSQSTDTLIVGAGCFWCVEQIFQDLVGVIDVESGYAGGARPNPTYEQVCSGVTGHAEVVRIEFDPTQVTRESLLRVFFVAHDPTTLNRQGPDVGTQYRSVVFFRDDAERELAERVRDEVAAQQVWSDPIVTTFEPLRNYTRAEEYHQDYWVKFEQAGPFEKMRMNAGYCNAVVGPKIAKFRKEHPELLKTGV